MLQTQGFSSSRSKGSPQQRLAGIVVVGGLHLAVIFAFIVALKPTILTVHPRDIVGGIIPDKTSVDQDQPKLPPLKFIKPQTDAYAPPPLNPTTPSKSDQGLRQVSTQPPAGSENPPAYIAARALLATHTTPAYPPLDIRLGHEGNVLLRLSIAADGAVSDASVLHSSGYDGLDRAAVAWVKEHWRYAPATRAGLAVPSTTDALVTFRLTDR